MIIIVIITTIITVMMLLYEAPLLAELERLGWRWPPGPAQPPILELLLVPEQEPI